MKILKEYRNQTTELYNNRVSFKIEHEYTIIEETRHKKKSENYYMVQMHNAELLKLLLVRFSRRMPKLMARIIIAGLSKVI